MRLKIIFVIGARPQFIKHAPMELACRGRVEVITIHTGQHYDANMSNVFFSELGMEPPQYMLHTGGGNHGHQTGRMLMEIEPILEKEKPDFMLVYGDTNSTIAGALAASKLHIPVIHVEAGLRSYNKLMPEEINRILTDHLSTLLFTSTTTAVSNLEAEGITDNVFLTGDIMADSVRIASEVNTPYNYDQSDPYYFVTVHRPYNTDSPGRLQELLEVLNSLNLKVIFPIHPRTRILAAKYLIDLSDFKNIEFKEPLSYFENIHALKNAKHAITDSGGLQKEAYILKTPCITVRSETEWTETLKNNWNVLCFENLADLPSLLNREIGEHNPSLYGDGYAADAIVDAIIQFDRK